MKGDSKKTIAFILVLVLGFIPLGLNASDYAGSVFTVSNPVFGEGGAVSAFSENFSAKGVIGKTEAIGKSVGANFTVRGGFQYYDETPPLVDSAFVNDGAGADEDEQAALNSLSANWGGFADPESGISVLSPTIYAVFRESDGKFWNRESLSWQTAEFWSQIYSSSTTISPVYLATGETYIFKVKIYNNANMISSPVVSDGICIVPSLSFFITSDEVDLGELDETNNFVSENASTTLRTSTNAYRGYSVNVWTTTVLTNTEFPSENIPDFFGVNENPELWNGECENNEYCAFGYSTNDNDLVGGLPDRFVSGGEKYAGFSHLAPGDIVADHTDFITGVTGAVENEEFFVKYKTAVDIRKIPGSYSTVAVFIAIPNF